MSAFTYAALSEFSHSCGAFEQLRTQPWHSGFAEKKEKVLECLSVVVSDQL